ncbi:hypothetical protein MKS88_001034 [Plasmodium brasilianum]|uniref:Early transcribed membrane protein (ETRAMP) n=2 Tax=Plasmodium (Plasmodium) TaxID=418103 RepID=A0A1A8WW24_PLAMA|nr:uncharacterized protein PMUG01_03032200 [Plasmodium malariae]KAI4840799.1 hypothetical protein MKS88_001034 [Plasmodium brasilianum]SBS97164.1 early transcribed membrane protein (ETRAMP) [Plasmodium malariae]SBT86363.1 hypothetical protein PMUG01_03032200 [Plasmodium malariae]
MKVINLFVVLLIILAISSLEPYTCINISSVYIKNELQKIEESIRKKNRNNKIMHGSLALGLTFLAASALVLRIYMQKRKENAIENLSSKVEHNKNIAQQNRNCKDQVVYAKKNVTTKEYSGKKKEIESIKTVLSFLFFILGK